MHYKIHDVLDNPVPSKILSRSLGQPKKKLPQINHPMFYTKTSDCWIRILVIQSALHSWQEGLIQNLLKWMGSLSSGDCIES